MGKLKEIKIHNDDFGYYDIEFSNYNEAIIFANREAYKQHIEHETAYKEHLEKIERIQKEDPNFKSYIRKPKNFKITVEILSGKDDGKNTILYSISRNKIRDIEKMGLIERL